eukprot:m.641326 g.641326  ORF g.641326 m.641326 type:complete len:390 (-) comp22629_c0_seq9:1755-2924(-)
MVVGVFPHHLCTHDIQDHIVYPQYQPYGFRAIGLGKSTYCFRIDLQGSAHCRHCRRGWYREYTVWSRAVSGQLVGTTMAEMDGRLHGVGSLLLIYFSLHTETVSTGVHDMNIVTYTESRAMFFDIVIEQGMQLSLEHVQALQNNGTKVVSFRTGNDYFLMIENMMFRKGKSSLFNTHGYDMVWTIPSFNATASFQHIAFRSDVHVAPYVWSPFFTDGTTKLLPSRRKYLPRPQKTIATFEPNLNVVKTSVIPMVIVEALFRRNPALVHKVIVTNTAEIVKDAEEFIYFAASLDITQAKKIWFEGRYKFPWFVSEYADVVLSHQWANGLNFLYLDALHLRYPLVHNSESLVCIMHNYDAGCMVHYVGGPRGNTASHRMGQNRSTLLRVAM